MESYNGITKNTLRIAKEFKEKSINGKPINKNNIRNSKISNINWKKKIIEFSLCVATMTGLVKIISDMTYQYKTISDYAQENNLDIVRSNTYRTDDRENYYYDHESIAREILDSENPEFTIYLCFKDMDGATAPKYGTQELRNMNMVFKELNKQCTDNSVYKKYNTFEDYLVMNGYCDSEGNADYGLYDDYTKNRLLRFIEHEKEGKSY